jgi:hypothetical protein
MIWAWAVISALWCVFVLVWMNSIYLPCACETPKLGSMGMLTILAVIVVPPLLVLGAGTAVARVVRSLGRA